MSDLAQFFIQELQKLPADRGLQFLQRNQAVIRCPFHSGGNERTPSLGINLSTHGGKPIGVWNCLACGEHGGWSKFAHIFDLKSPTNAAVKEAKNAIYMPPEELDYLPDHDSMSEWPESMTWRGIKGKIVRLFNGKLMVFRNEPSLYFPVLCGNEVEGGVYARLKKGLKDEEHKSGYRGLSYINTPGQWVNHNLFGYDLASSRLSNHPLWIVEGPRDCMNLWQHGARAVALLGAGSVTRQKVILLQQIDTPVYLLALDPDEAGEKSFLRLKDALTERRLPWKRIRMKEGTDPADLSKKVVDRINARAISDFREDSSDD